MTCQRLWHQPSLVVPRFVKTCAVRTSVFTFISGLVTEGTENSSVLNYYQLVTVTGQWPVTVNCCCATVLARGTPNSG